jgi:hypothetical protein
MGVLEVLFLIFVTLKLTGVIAWSWWWVFAPLYPAILIWLIVLIFIIGAAISGTLEYKRFKRK